MRHRSEPAPDAPAPDTETEQHVRDAVDSAVSRKAEELRVLAMGEVADFTDYFVICSGTNTRQVQAISDAIEETLRARKVRPLHVEGYRGGNWVLMDYGDFVVHVFLDDRRKFYGLERLWNDAPVATGRFLSATA